MSDGLLQNKIIHSFFEITVLMKGIHGVLEIIVGILFFFIKTETVYTVFIHIINQRIIKSSGHFATNYLTKQANNFSLGTKYFIAVYFLFYGVVNIFLVISLLKGRLWAYPTAIVSFILFAMYQVYRSFTHHSQLLLYLSLFDVLLVGLILLEYKRLKKEAIDTSPSN